MSACWRCGKEMTEADEKRVNRVSGGSIRMHFTGGIAVRDARGRAIDQTCAGKK